MACNLSLIFFSWPVHLACAACCLSVFESFFFVVVVVVHKRIFPHSEVRVSEFGRLLVTGGESSWY